MVSWIDGVIYGAQFLLMFGFSAPQAAAFDPAHPIFNASVSWQGRGEFREQFAEGIEAEVVLSTHLAESGEEWRRTEYSVRGGKLLETFEIWGPGGFVRSWTRILRQHDGQPWIWVHPTWCVQKIGGGFYIVATHLYDEGGSIVPLK